MSIARKKALTTLLNGGVFSVAMLGLASPALAQEAAQRSTEAEPIPDIVVTANKRVENIQDVGMSIQAASGDRLTKLGLTNPADLQKIVPGFLFTPTVYGTSVFTIRGVGFQDVSLAASPTVSIYLDEAPLPFSFVTNGVSLDVERVEVLKGPQGTLYGNNATGGAINYVANKPTDAFAAGADFSFGRFNDTDIQGFVSGPIASNLDARLAVRVNESGPWQKTYAPQAPQDYGGKNFLNGRLSLSWKPSDHFTSLLTLSGWRDKGYTQMPQLFGVAPISPYNPISPTILNFPLAPHNNQAADFNSCVNNSPFNPIANQSAGAQWLIGGGRLVSEGPGSAVQAGGQPTSCESPRKDNSYFSATLKMTYNVGSDIALTSMTSYQRLKRHEAVDASGLPVEDYQVLQSGNVSSLFQELRLAGKLGGKGSWLIGANYEHDKTYDSYLETYSGSTTAPGVFYFDGSPEGLAELAGGSPTSTSGISTEHVLAMALGPDRPYSRQETDTYSAYANVEYPILRNLTFQVGARFTRSDKKANLCDNDGGDGSWAAVGYVFQEFLGSTSPLLAAPGTCATIGDAASNYNAPVNGYDLTLNQSNLSWRTGLNWKVTPRTLLYANVSRGYKSGSFPTLPFSTSAQINPVVQESLLAYEVGFKAAFFNRQLTLDGAGFYYDYTNKQVTGAVVDPLFGPLPTLINVPKSHVSGFEVAATWVPEWIHGLTVTSSLSYQDSSIDKSSRNACDQAGLTNYGNGSACISGNFYNFDVFGRYADFTHQTFPQAPKWQASFDAEYDWTLKGGLAAFVGGTASYVADTHASFVNTAPAASATIPNDPLAIPGHTLIDLRAGLSKDRWRFQVWGRNVTNKWYWTTVAHSNDMLVRYTGMPATYGITLSYRYH